jgi:hypothetical protein
MSPFVANLDCKLSARIARPTHLQITICRASNIAPILSLRGTLTPCSLPVSRRTVEDAQFSGAQGIPS